MTDKKTEALKLALEALQEVNYDQAYAAEISAIRDALAEQPAQQHIEYCLWARNGHTPCPHVQPAPVPEAHKQQEPVAWMWRCKPYCDWPEWSVSLKRPADSGRDGHKRTEGYEDVPLYTSPPASKPLTDDKYEAIVEDIADWNRYVEVDTAHQSLEKHVREVLTAHGIKGDA